MTAEAQTISWQEAIARLAQERTLAETAVMLLKKYGDAAAIDHGMLSYVAAKSEYDGIIGGLSTALAQKSEPQSLESLDERLNRAFVLRSGFCTDVNKLLPPSINASHEKSWISDIVGGAVGPVLEAVKAIWFRAKDDNAMRRKTIETQLLATKWPDFTSIPSAP
jgi:hypothetical protein